MTIEVVVYGIKKSCKKVINKIYIKGNKLIVWVILGEIYYWVQQVYFIFKI